MLLGAYGSTRPGGLCGGCLHHHKLHTARVAAPCRLRVSAGTIGPGKKWEHYETDDRGIAVRHKLHIKKGDLVKVIAGNDKGKVGKITEVNLKLSKVVVEGVNVRGKIDKRRAPQEGQSRVQESESPISASNVMLYSESQKVASRVGHRVLDDGKRVRYLKKTGEVID